MFPPYVWMVRIALAAEHTLDDIFSSMSKVVLDVHPYDGTDGSSWD